MFNGRATPNPVWFEIPTAWTTQVVMVSGRFVSRWNFPSGLWEKRMVILESSTRKKQGKHFKKKKNQRYVSLRNAGCYYIFIWSWKLIIRVKFVLDKRVVGSRDWEINNKSITPPEVMLKVKWLREWINPSSLQFWHSLCSLSLRLNPRKYSH